MVPVTLKFPMLKLPLLARENVMRRMNSLDRMTFSFCSKRTKKFVKLLRLSPHGIQIIFADEIFILISKMDEEQYNLTFDNPEEGLGSSCTVTGWCRKYDKYGRYCENRSVQKHIWKIPNFSAKEWVAHVLEVIDRNRLSFKFDCCDLFSSNQDIDQWTGNLKPDDLTIFKLTTPKELLLKVLETFRPTKYLSLSENPFPDNSSFQKYLRNSIDEVVLDHNVTTTANDIYPMNCKILYILSPHIPTQALNALLKVWSEGWTPRMKFMSIRYDPSQLGENYMEEIMGGLEFLQIEGKREINDPRDDTLLEIYSKTYDIVRKDGQRATVSPMVFGGCDGRTREIKIKVYINDE